MAQREEDEGSNFGLGVFVGFVGLVVFVLCMIGLWHVLPFYEPDTTETMTELRINRLERSVDVLENHVEYLEYKERNKATQ